MPCQIQSATLLGIDAVGVTVEVDVAFGLPTFNVVGLPETSVKESRVRVEAALQNAGFEFPDRRITVNLAPADVRKVGTSLDLPIALGILAEQGHIPPEALRAWVIAGELSLSGSLLPVRGSLALALFARKIGAKNLLVPSANANEAALVSPLNVYGQAHLCDVVEGLNDHAKLKYFPAHKFLPEAGVSSMCGVDFSEVRGQAHAKRALEVAAAGGHNVLMVGPPGSGKTMLARRLPTILPALSFEEALETTQVYSALGLRAEHRPLLQERPFRAPHHTISDAGLVGGGTFPRPGEVSLAHHGVLFLDELPEFQKHVLEVLRQPLEDGHVSITRSQLTVRFPCALMLIAACNPCPCGFAFDPKHACTCTRAQKAHYQSRLSGPLLDRIDIQIEVPATGYRHLAATVSGESSRVIRERVVRARLTQQQRFLSTPAVRCNAQMTVGQVQKYCTVGSAGHVLLERVVDKLGMSARAYNRILKVARTIADLAAAPEIDVSHLSEAIQYRSLDRNLGPAPGPTAIFENIRPAASVRLTV